MIISIKAKFICFLCLLACISLTLSISNSSEVDLVQAIEIPIFDKAYNVKKFSDRSISAWGKILDYFPWQKKGILNIIAHLKRLCKTIEIEYPNARSFVRPSFDETNT